MKIWRRWKGLLLLSGAGVLGLDALGIPAAMLLGPMIAGAMLAARGPAPRLPGWLFTAAQAVIGCMIAALITRGMFADLAQRWPVLLAVSSATILTSAASGWMLARLGVIPRSAAVWGSMPGGATAMVLLAHANGADARLVAVMAYSRVVLVTVAASLLAAAVDGGGHLVPPSSPVLGMRFTDIGTTAAVAAVGVLAGRALRIPAGALVCTLVIGAAFSIEGNVSPGPPRPLLGFAYAVVGWRIGLGFTQETLGVAARALPAIAASAALLIVMTGFLAWPLSRLLGTDFITALLAAAPGGMDSVALIAASSGADVPLVMGFQLTRFLMVLLIGPALGRALSPKGRSS